MSVIDPSTPNLTAEELAAAQKYGMDPKKYEAMKGVTTYADWCALQASSAHDTEHDRTCGLG